MKSFKTIAMAALAVVLVLAATAPAGNQASRMVTPVVGIKHAIETPSVTFLEAQQVETDLAGFDQKAQRINNQNLIMRTYMLKKINAALRPLRHASNKTITCASLLCGCCREEGSELIPKNPLWAFSKGTGRRSLEPDSAVWYHNFEMQSLNH